MLFRLALRINFVKTETLPQIASYRHKNTNRTQFHCGLLCLFVFVFKFCLLALFLSLSFSLEFFSSFLLLALHLNYARFCDTRKNPASWGFFPRTWGLAFTKSFASRTCAQLACLPPLTMPKRNLCSHGIHTLILAIFFGQACSSFMWEYWVFKPLEKKQPRILVDKIKIIRHVYLNEPIFRRRIYLHHMNTHKRKTEITFVKRSQADVIKGFVYITFNGILNISVSNF